jgi:hypothetical protein
MTDEPRSNENSSLAAVAITLVGAAVALAVSFGFRVFLVYEIAVWERAAEVLQGPLRYLAYGGGVLAAALVGLVAPPAGRLALNIDNRFPRWLALFGVGMSAITVAVGAGFFATKCVPPALGPYCLGSIGLLLLAWAAILFGAWGSIRAVRV